MTTGQTLPESTLSHRSTRRTTMPAYARLAMGVMQRLSVGSLTVRMPDGQSVVLGRGDPHAELILANWNVARAAMRSGDIGFGETFIAGDWTTPNLSQLMLVMVSNRNAITDVIYGRWWGKILFRLRHLLHPNSRSGSKRNIEAHYDIGNSFYREWLDAGMTYSSAMFSALAGDVSTGTSDDRLLPAAQDAKYERLLGELELKPGSHLLEIGCGWGGLAERAAARGAHVTGITLSSEQLDYAQLRLAERGLLDRCELLLQDYRDCKSAYDAIASVEMFEAVGERYWPAYFETVKRCLKPGGRAVVQTITIDERLFEEYRGGSDFIQQYIFPGGMLPSIERFTEAARQAGLAVVKQHAFGQDYARTLQVWTQRFLARENEILAQGFDTAFMRTWHFYLAYCEAAFRCSNTDVVQFTLEHAS